MSDSSLSSREIALRSSDSLYFDKLKPYNFESTVSDNESTKGEVSTKLCKQRKLKRLKGKYRLVSLWKIQEHLYQF